MMIGFCIDRKYIKVTNRQAASQPVFSKSCQHFLANYKLKTPGNVD